MATLEEKIKAQVEALLKPTLDNIADAIRYHTGNTKLIPFTNMPDIIKYQLQKAGSESEGDVVVGIEGVYEEGDTIRINFAGVNEGVANAMLQYSFAKATIDQTIDSTIEFTQGNSNARIVYKGTNADIDLTNALGNVNISVDENLPPNVTATGLDHTKILYPHKILGVEGTSMAIVPSGTKPIVIERGVENMEVDVKEFEKVSITTNINTELPTYQGYAVLHNVEVNPESVFFPAEAGSYMAGFWVPPVTKEIDGNIRPENIKKDVSILGEIGLYQGIVDVEKEGTAVNPSAIIHNIYFNLGIDYSTSVQYLNSLGLSKGGFYYVCGSSDGNCFIMIQKADEDTYNIVIKDGDSQFVAYGSSENFTYRGFFINHYFFKNEFVSSTSLSGQVVGNKNDLIKELISITSYRIEMDWESVMITPREDSQVIYPSTNKAIYQIDVEPIKAENISYKFNLQEFQGLTADVIKHDVEILGIVGTYYGDNLSTEIPEITSNGRHDVAQYEYIDVNVPMGYGGVTSDGRTALNIDNTDGKYQGISIKAGADNASLEGVQLLVKGTGVLFDNEVDNSTIGVNGSENILSIIDSDGLTGSIQADSATLDLVLTDSELDLSYCSSEIVIIDNFTNKHNYVIDNLKKEHIKNGITILGVEGNYVGEQASGTLTITENGNYSVASYANVIVQVPDNSITGVTTTGANGTMRIDHSNTVESFYTILNGSPYVTLAYTIGATVTFTKDNGNANVNLGGIGGNVNIGSNCAGTYTINIGGRTMVVEFSSTGVLSRITLDGVEV